MSRILALRFSALGDLAMTVPVIHSFAESFPNDEVVVVSREKWSALFSNMPGNVRFYGIDLQEYSGLRGLERLYGELRREGIDAVADLHDVLRTKYLAMRFRIAGIPVAAINKGRREKRELTREKHKKLVQLKTSTQRYHEVFEKLGYSFELDFRSVFDDDEGDVGTLASVIGAKNENEWVGIAPFAQHEGKIYPVKLMEHVVSLLCKHPRRKVFIFGGGAGEQRIAEEWERRYPAVVSVVGKGRMIDELGVMSRMDIMLTMDSANMHLASITGIKVFSIWGATHPAAGFGAWQQTPDSYIQTDMECRPCSVFGNRKCRRGDYACLSHIDPNRVAEKLETALEARKLSTQR
jgi:ADP-heptose:LPS heptosyltransferase